MTTDFAVAGAVATALANVLAGGFGAWRWWTIRPARACWIAIRCGQAAAALLAVLAGLLAATGHEPGDGLFWLYMLLPAAVSFVAEQLRALAAQTILDARGLPDARAVGRLGEADQRTIVLAIVRRELGTMALAAFVIAFLAARAAGTA